MGHQPTAPPAHAAASPATANGGEGVEGAAAAVPPAWSRPDDASRQAQLDAMKRRATGLLALAVVVFATARVLEAQYPWLGWVRATAEASLVGGLADWFAVTALFRHPLGLPIPHTAIVATRKRSEEHTSELQSPCNLVCRLLLEKKKKKVHNTKD